MVIWRLRLPQNNSSQPRLAGVGNIRGRPTQILLGRTPGFPASFISRALRLFARTLRISVIFPLFLRCPRNRSPCYYYYALGPLLKFPPFPILSHHFCFLISRTCRRGLCFPVYGGLVSLPPLVDLWPPPLRSRSHYPLCFLSFPVVSPLLLVVLHLRGNLFLLATLHTFTRWQ